MKERNMKPVNPRLASLLLLVPLLLAVPAKGASFTLTWTDNSDNETGFKIERKLGTTGTFAEIGQVGVDINTFVDVPPDSQEYCYQVRAFNSSGDSPYSNEACGTGSISAPSDLAITP